MRLERTYLIDGLLLRRLLVDAGHTQEEFCGLTGVDKNTMRKIFDNKPVAMTTITTVAEHFSIKNHLELLHPDEHRKLGIDPSVRLLERYVLEWEVDSFLTPWDTTRNGLQYITAKLEHRFLLNRWARWKCFELRHLPIAEREQLEEHLERHADVCERIGKHPNIAENRTATWVGADGHWWVLDRWEEGETLEERLRRGSLNASELRVVLGGIAQGLKALHAEKIIRRELSPRFVILREKDGSPVLTDFELAKLLENVPTVSPKGDWPDDLYRAVEVAANGTVDERADLYSWGRIFVHAATGTLPPAGEEASLLQGLAVPKALMGVVLKCLALPSSDRPGGINEVLAALRRWKA